ncbi:MAG: agarase, partial [Verrucomicrobiia bacterium]
MRTSFNRRQFLGGAAAFGAYLSLGNSWARATAARTTQRESQGFFSLGQRKDHWWLLDPSGNPFFTMGLNHIDPASLRYPENIDIWREKYNGSTIKWIEESVRPNLKA